MKKETDLNEQIVKKFYDKEHLLSHVEKGYSRFLEGFLPKFFQKRRFFMVRAFDKKTDSFLRYYLEFGKVSLVEGGYSDQNRNYSAFTNEVAHEHNLTRELKVYVETNLYSQREDSEELELLSKKNKKYEIGRIPFMVNSRYDEGTGVFKPYYFIINGTARILYNLVEKKNFQKTYEKISEDHCTLKIARDLENGTGAHKFSIDLAKRQVLVTFGRSKMPVNLFHLLKLIGVGTEKILKELSSKNLLDLSILSIIEEGYEKDEDEMVLSFYDMFLKKKFSEEVLTVEQKKKEVITYLQDYYLRNKESRNFFKVVESLDIVSDLLKILKHEVAPPFADSPENKRLVGVYAHFERCFNKGFTLLIEQAKTTFLKQFNSLKRSRDLSRLFKVDTLKKEFKRYLVQGKSNTTETYTENLNPTNLHQEVSLQRKVVCALNKTLTHANYRSINPLKGGRLCPAHTPYSRSVGLVENLALGAKVTEKLELEPELELKDSSLYLDQLPVSLHGLYLKTYLNGRFYGYLEKKDLEKKLMRLKRKNNHFSYNFLDQGEEVLELRTDEGRILKAFYVVEKEKVRIKSLKESQVKNLTIEDLCSQNYMVFLDPGEELHAKIAPTVQNITKETEYIYLDPVLYMSYFASLLPYININAAHRASLSVRLLIQSLGSKKDKNLLLRKALKADYLAKANPSIIGTYFDKYNLSQDELGQNIILAFNYGENEEDSVYVNESAVQRGLLDHFVFKKFLGEAKKTPQDIFDHLPLDESGLDGLPQIGQTLDGEPILKKYYMQELETKSKTTLGSPSVPYKVESIVIDSTKKETLEVEIVLKKLRRLYNGAKVGTRSGLKGVVSKCITEMDMNISENGVNPGIVYSNHVINSRMVLGPLAEIFYTKALVLEGKRKITSSFVEGLDQKEEVEAAQKVLTKNRMDPKGYETQFDVNLFEKVQVFMGPTKILLLEHYSLDKSYSRSNYGGTSFLTRQPGEGRSVKGGLRIGEMENNAIIEHVATEFIKDKLGVDLQKVRLCEKCGSITDQLKDKEDFCKFCNTNQFLNQVSMPYAFILLTKVNRALNIETSFHTQEFANLEDVKNGEQVEALDSLESLEKKEEDLAKVRKRRT